MSFKILKEKPSLESLTGKEIQIEFSEGPREGFLEATNNPSHPYSFNFTKMGTEKRLYFTEEDVKITKKGIKYTSDFYAIETFF